MQEPKQFSLLIKPASADCNLHCGYCFYMDHQGFYPESKIHRMPDDVLEKMVSSYMSTSQRQYVFLWQGGEPTLMGCDFYKRVIELQKKYGGKGTVVANAIQTNGLLIDDDLARHFAEYRFLVGVSLDGPGEIHDLYRKKHSGGGSHKEVLAGIEILKKHGVDFNILCLVSKANVKNAKELFHYYVENDFKYLQFIPCVEFDEPHGLAPFAVTAEEWGTFLCTLFDEWMKYGPENVYIRGFEAILGRLADNRILQCSMGSNCCVYFVVEWNGDIFPCDFFVKKELLLGNLCRDSWEKIEDSDIYHKFGMQKSMRNAACRLCPYLKLCAGDCLKHRLQGAFPRPEKLSVLCEGWKMFFKHSLPRFKKLARKMKAQLDS